jgi:hypothetical protein
MYSDADGVYPHLTFLRLRLVEAVGSLEGTDMVFSMAAR